MKTDTLRLLWSLIEETPKDLLADMNQDELVILLSCRLNKRVYLDPAERLDIQQYLYTRSQLIQDVFCEQTVELSIPPLI